MSLRCLVSLALLLAPSTASADVIRVPGEQLTIQEAVDAAGPGDQIQVSKGTYTPFTVEGKTDLEIKGNGKPVVAATGVDEAAATVLGSDRITIAGLVIRSAMGHGVLITGSTNVVVQKCTIEDVGEDGVHSDSSTQLRIEKCTIQRAVSDGVEFEADDPTPQTTNSIIAKNKFMDIDGEALDLDGTGHEVEKNRIDGTGNEGIKLEEDSGGIRIEKNKVANTGGDAIVARGDANVIEKNKITNAGNHGINVVGDDNVAVGNKLTTGMFDGIRARGARNHYEKNKIKDFGDGFDVEADDSEFISNKMTSCRANGFEIGSGDNGSDGNLIEKNKVSKSGENGFYVHDATNNTFQGNKASSSVGFDLLDETGAGTQTYQDNRFGTESIP